MKRRTRQTILEAAQKLFPTRGYDRTSIESLATEARVTKMMIYRHFENKEALFSAALHGFFEEFREEADADSHVRAAVDIFLRAYGSRHAPGSMPGTKGALAATNAQFITPTAAG